MSYILDALRKADAERERDPARGIHAQPLAPAAPAARAAWQRALPWFAGVGAVLLAVAALWPRGRPLPPPPAPQAAGSVALSPLPTPAVPPATVLQPAPPPMPPAPRAQAAPAPPPAAQAAAPRSAPVAQAAASAASGSIATAPAPVASRPAPAAAERLATLAELPQDLQRELGRLAISGGVYSQTPAQRMLIVGGQVVGEGAELAPGIVLEQIGPRTAVLKLRSGQRVALSY